MALTSSIVIRQAYVRIGAWQGDSTEIDAQYNADIDFEQIVSEAFPAQSMWDMLTGVENEIATAVAKNKDNILRSSIESTVSATSGSLIPDIGAGAARVIGELGQVFDADTSEPLTQGLHLDEIRAFNQGSVYKSSLFSYVLVPPRIFATVPNLIIDVCVFDQVARAAAIAANGALLFQMCQDAYFNGLMTYLRNEDPNYAALSSQHEPLYRAWLEAQAPQAVAA